MRIRRCRGAFLVHLATSLTPLIGSHIPFRYIPELAAVDPNQYGLAVCSIDGQRMEIGDSTVQFCVQSCSKPITYCMALEERGLDKVHQHISREPSGRPFNEVCLDTRREPNTPHNPLINAGAIMACSLVRSTDSVPERLAAAQQTWARLAGGGDTLDGRKHIPQ